jgi:hypothetical protein
MKEDLRKWFKEKWVDVSRKNADGSHPSCGASSGSKGRGDGARAYPKCVKKSKANKMTDKDKETATRRKRDVYKGDGDPPKKAINVKTDSKKEAYVRQIIRNVIREERIKIKETSSIRGKTIINVDIQPEYANWINFDLHEWADWLNENSQQNDIIFLYNGADTLGMISERDYKNWLMYDIGVSEDVVWNAEFFDKGYAFFRGCMDNGWDNDALSDLARLMYKYGISDSRDIGSSKWDKFVSQSEYIDDELREFLEGESETFYIPEVMDFLKRKSNILLTGGGANECLKEVEIALDALNKNYKQHRRYIY